MELDLSILWPAFLAGLLVAATHVPLGMQVLARGIVFIDIAIAQIAGCGVLLADRMGFEAEGIAVQVAALAAAIAGSLLLTWTEKVWPDVQEAVIGVVFVLAATGGVLLLASNAHGSEHLRDLLVGQILWVQPARLLPVAICMLVSACGGSDSAASTPTAATAATTSLPRGTLLQSTSSLYPRLVRLALLKTKQARAKVAEWASGIGLQLTRAEGA